MLDSRHVANEFIRLSEERGSSLTHMQIQKLVYFAHARMLSLHGEPLLAQKFEAWKLGPVIRTLYDALKNNGPMQVKAAIPMAMPADLSTREKDTIAWAFAKYRQLGGQELSKLTHAPDAPWYNAKSESSLSNPIIDNDLIGQYYWAEWQEDLEVERERLRDDPEVQAAIAEGFTQLDCGESHSASSPEELQELVASRARSR